MGIVGWNEDIAAWTGAASHPFLHTGVNRLQGWLTVFTTLVSGYFFN
ncbi:MAG: hypothetical protein ICV54_22410 [Nostoc sp. C3-bin3]|nr:hypothetical protein [Nostoc sp. C3-bin3]